MSLTQGTWRALLRGGKKAWSIQFPDHNLGGITFGSGAEIDDLFSADCTIEFYFRKGPDGFNAYFLSKTTAIANGWVLYMHPDGTVRYVIRYDANNVNGLSGATYNDGVWHHLAFDFEAATKTGRLFIDGILVSSDIGAGNYVVDAADDCIVNGLGAIGTSEDIMEIGWIRLSDTRRYAGLSFSPPTRFDPPSNDANAQLLAPVNDGGGTNIADLSGNSYDGTLSFGATTRWFYG